MSRLSLHDDGTITLPLRKRDPITLPEPSIAELAAMTGFIVEADASLPAVPSLPATAAGETPDMAALTAANEQLRLRTVATYSTDSPYGLAICKIVKLTLDEDITLADLPGWAASPTTCRSILAHWQTPLVGED